MSVNVPEAAMEAAFAKYSELDARNLTFDTSYVLRHTLTAAVPHITVQALKDYRDYVARTMPNRVLTSTPVILAELDARIARIEAER